MMYIINKSLIALVISYECKGSRQFTAIVTKVFIVLHKLLWPCIQMVTITHVFVMMNNYQFNLATKSTYLQNNKIRHWIGVPSVPKNGISFDGLGLLVIVNRVL